MLKKLYSFILKYKLYLITAILILAVFFIVKNTLTLKTTSSVWDGTVALDFAEGSGSANDPYVINDGSELAYFFTIINSDDNSDYFNKYYVLNNNINLNDNEISFTNFNKIFSGYFDGQGYNIFNFKVSSFTHDNKDYYSLFGNLNSAIIENVNIYDVDIETNDTTNDIYVGLIGLNVQNTTITNISLYNINYENSCSECNIYSSFGILSDNGNNTLSNLNVKASSNVDSTRGLIENYTDAQISNIIYNINDLDLIFDYDENINDTLYKYSIVENKIKFNDNYSLKTIKEMLDANSEYEWDYTNCNYKLLNNGINETNIFSFPMLRFVFASPSAHTSGIDGNVVYINDYDKDYDYYMGLNYTNSSDNKTPSLEDKQIYTSDNLVYVNANYFGRDINSTYSATVSLNESQNQYSYYNVYPVNNNGTDSADDDYIEFELIQNPFTNRPTDMGFNGWVTDYTDAELTIDMDVYTRWVKIPVSYTNDNPDNITINFYASWAEANVAYMFGSTEWTTVASSLEDGGMMPAKGTKYEYEDVSVYYIQGTINRNRSYPSGAYNSSARSVSGRCNSSRCTYYILNTSSTYDENTTYYKKNTNSFSVYTPQATAVTVDKLDEGALTANYFLEASIIRGNSVEGYYDEDGNLLSGNCTTSGGCTVYDLIPYKDENGNVNVADSTTSYYYLVTRDINIVVLTGNNSNNWTSSMTKPFTFTSLHNGTSYISSAYWNVRSKNVTAYSDINIENIEIYNNTSKTTSSVSPSGNYGFTGNLFNVRFGRGITQNGTYVNFNYIMGAKDTTAGSSSNIIKYSLIVESGIYNAISCASGSNSGGYSSYVSYYIYYDAVFGNDYDRVNEDNDNMEVVYSLSATFGGRYNSSSVTDKNMNMTVLSGSYGTNEYDITTGIYAGGRGWCYTNVIKQVFIKGGDIYYLDGGPAGPDTNAGNNNLFIYIMGGTIEMVYGGAALTETTGNRIIQMTGGKVNYSIFGGSNGVEGTSGTQGRVNGDSYIYVGGDAVVGDATLVSNNTINDNDSVEAGSVFGAGNGNSSYSTIGTVNNSYVVIDSSAQILRNVYGGGNYGAAGTLSSGANTGIRIIGGTVSGNVYMGGNNNGAGTSSYATGTNNITMTGGTVTGSIYGGSRTKGIIYGDVSLNINDGTVTTDVYGGGEGGYSSSTDYGTYVKGDVDVTIGTSTEGPTISGNVYGGSAYGTVNAYYNGSSVSTSSGKNVDVTVNNGNISGSVFGGAKGSSSYTPYVKGNITVNINGGTINAVYGGFDAAGTPEGTDYVYLNGGTIGSAFGGGNNTSSDETHIYLRGATATNVYGGDNNSGDVPITNVYVESGNAGSVYGGNNQGGTCTTTNVTVTGGTVTGAVYGGGNAVATTTTNVKIYNGTIENVFGGGNEAGATTTNVTTYTADPNNIDITNIYGGSNQSGTINNSYVTINHGTIDYVYGGNNQGGSTTTPKVVINDGEIINVYGGGNKATSPSTDVEINGGTITNAYGGGNEANVTTSNINIKGGTTTNVFGGGNQANVTTTNVTLTSGTVTNTFGGGNQAGATTANITANSSSTINNTNVYGGSNQSGTVGSSIIKIDAGTYGSIYGGNNQGGTTTTPSITINNGTIENVFGGGNQASIPSTNVVINGGSIENVYGGGNEAGVVGATNLYVYGGTISENVYGGGNEGTVGTNTNVYINNAIINGSAYAGGNGSTATVSGNTNIYVGGDTIIGTSSCTLLSHCSVFGGGNAAYTGNSTDNDSQATVNIMGATIYGNVYGGANTSVVYGKTDVNIGATATNNSNSNVVKDDILIYGTVFGGGEANASGSSNYDYSFISVTDDITVDIDGTNYTNLDIKGSIFGSGNASTTSESASKNVNIVNYGVYGSPKYNVSIQRVDLLTIDNSAIVLSGASDRTNDYSDVLFSLSIIDELRLQNSSTLYMKNGANLLLCLKSMDSDGNLATVDIDSENGTYSVDADADNRIYMYPGKVLNIATNQSITSYGEVYGMTFFGMYKYNSDGTVNVGIYDKYDYGETIAWNSVFSSGSYVLGLHKTNHDIEADGFYSNFVGEGSVNTVAYIEPTPQDAAFYRWVIGEEITEYEVNLAASKYSTLGTVEFPFTDSSLSRPNTSFEILGFDYSEIASGITLVDKNSIPKIASGDNADNVFGLTMEAGNSGWLTSGTTSFYTSSTTPISGITTYVGDNTSSAPTLLFYLYHSKNIQTSGNLGTVSIVIQAVTKLNDLESETKRIIVKCNLSRILYNTNEYEAALTPGRKYELFTSSLTNVTSNSSISAYFSLSAMDSNVYKTGYHRSLTTNYVLPLNTKITMLDLSGSSVQYYYHIIDATDVTNATNQIAVDGEANYDLSLFEVMGAFGSGVYYNDATMNQQYYNSTGNYSEEEFIFIIDYEDTNITSNITNGYILLEMQDSQDETKIEVLGIEHSAMNHNIYVNQEAVIDLDGTISKDTIYAGETVQMDVTTTYNQTALSGDTIIDTSNNDQKLGFEITLINSNNEIVTGTTLLGLYYEINGVRYSPNIDGTTRVKIADKVGDTENWINVVTGTSSLASGEYTLRVESFSSSDGIYHGINVSDYIDFDITIINEIYGLDITSTAEDMIIDGVTGKSIDDDNYIIYNINYNSLLTSPNIHIKMSRRLYDEVYSSDFEAVDITDYVTNSLTSTSITNEYMLTNNPNLETTLTLITKTNLLIGTYKLEFILYDGTSRIGSLDKYIIIK